MPSVGARGPTGGREAPRRRRRVTSGGDIWGSRLGVTSGGDVWVALSFLRTEVPREDGDGAPDDRRGGRGGRGPRSPPAGLAEVFRRAAAGCEPWNLCNVPPPGRVAIPLPGRDTE
ncbi:unnamed protein product [Lampetra fluviatilis]